MKGKRKEEDKEEYRQLKEKNKFWGNKQKNAKIIKAKNKRPAGNDLESIFNQWLESEPEEEEHSFSGDDDEWLFESFQDEE